MKTGGIPLDIDDLKKIFRSLISKGFKLIVTCLSIKKKKIEKKMSRN